MDEGTIAKLMIEEAAMQRKRADREGVHIYLTKPTARVRPNPQFLRATMRSVEQSNRIVEVNEMWRRRTAELEQDRSSRKRRHGDDTRPGSRRVNSSYRSSRARDRDHVRRSSRHRRSVSEDDEEDTKDEPTCSYRSSKEGDKTRDDGRRRSSRHHQDRSVSEDAEEDFKDEPTCSYRSSRDRDDSRKRSSRHHQNPSVSEEEDTKDETTCSGELRDEEVEEFLNQRVKRGRGSVGSRMDETGPYPAATASAPEVQRTTEDWEKRLIGPRLPEKDEAEWKRAKLLEDKKSKEKPTKKKK